MKGSSNPRNGIPRGISPSEAANSPSPNPCPQKHQKPPRRARSGSENVDPNTISDPSLQSPSPAFKPPSGPKMRSPLPPRPPSNPLKRKLCMDAATFENAAPAANDSGVQVIVRIRPPNKEEEEGKQIVQKISTNSLSILDHMFTFDSVADADSTQVELHSCLFSSVS
ncbi:TRAFAC class myosin-kinesin ATPase superfamily [Asimina triloba]